MDWKQHHGNEAAKALEHELVTQAVDEYVHNMRMNYSVDLGKGLPRYGLAKVMGHVAAVTRARTLGFNPDLLRLSNDEADEAMLRIARMAAESGKPVWVLADPGPEEPRDE